MTSEHDRVVLKADVLEHGLLEGDVGTVVHVHTGGKAYEVDFVALNGETVAVVTLKASAVRSVGKMEITHARQLVSAQVPAVRDRPGRSRRNGDHTRYRGPGRID